MPLDDVLTTMRFDTSLLDDSIGRWLPQSTLGPCYNANGLYNPLSFTVRLSPQVHRLLDRLPPGTTVAANEYDWEVIQANSTYIHETIHWWQHIGSTVGLLLSLGFPAQEHINIERLQRLVHAIGPIKSIRKFDLLHATSNHIDRAVRQDINVVLNNWHDIEFAKLLMISPRHAERFVADPYFECVGHAYHIAWSSVIGLLAASEDPTFDFLPDFRNWGHEFERLKREQVEGFYFGSTIRVAEIGLREIFEGQARFCQLQYLCAVSGGRFDLNVSRDAGLFGKVYVDAFQSFLSALGEPWPVSPYDPLVNLFLLVCDLAINPGDGFPFDLWHFESFILSVDPGLRFTALCWTIRDRYPELKRAVVSCSREEYEMASELLSRAIGSPTPMEIASRVAKWSSEQASCRALLQEASEMKFGRHNVPVRLFFSEFLRFQQNKSLRPEFFCWPGYWSVSVKGDADIESARQLFSAHEALFLDTVDGEVQPRVHHDKLGENVQRMFDDFFSWNAAYLLSRQWMVEEGPFDLDFDWLTTKWSRDEMEQWCSQIFKGSFGVAPGEFQVL